MYEVIKCGWSGGESVLGRQMILTLSLHVRDWTLTNVSLMVLLPDIPSFRREESKLIGHKTTFIMTLKFAKGPKI